MKWDEIVANVSELGMAYGPKLLGVIAMLLFGWIIAGWVGRWTSNGLKKARVDTTLTAFLARFSRWGVLILVFIGCLSLFGVETTSFAAVLGSMGIAIGLALQGTLGHFASGIMLLLLRPFNIGDAVEIGGQSGKVIEIALFTTTLDTFDNKRIMIPNGQVFGDVIENITFHDLRRVDVPVGVDYSANIDETRDVLTKAATSVEGVLEDPEPAIVLLELGDSAVNWVVRAWTPTGEYWTVKQALLRSIKNNLDDADIGIPFPQMDVHVTKEG